MAMDERKQALAKRMQDWQAPTTPRTPPKQLPTATPEQIGQHLDGIRRNLQSERPALPMISGQTKPASECSVNATAETFQEPSSISSTTGAHAVAKRAPRQTGTRPGGIGAVALRSANTAAQDLATATGRDPAQANRAWRTFLPPRLVEEMTGIRQHAIPTDREYLQIIGLSWAARRVIVCEVSARKLALFLAICEPAAAKPSPERLRKIIAVGIAAFGSRGTREMAENEAMARARLRPWEAALYEFPEWAIAGAFTFCNRNTHPPRPDEVRDAAAIAEGGLCWFVERARAMVDYVRSVRPEWLK
jgi:hypothetical protein